MENKKFLNPQELFNTMREIRRQANDNLIALMKANNLTYVHTDVDVCSDADCDICCCHIFDNKTGGEYIATVQGVRLTANDKLEFDWSFEDCGTTDKCECKPIDVMNVYSTVYSLLVRKDGDGFNYKTWLEENADRYE